MDLRVKSQVIGRTTKRYATAERTFSIASYCQARFITPLTLKTSAGVAADGERNYHAGSRYENSSGERGDRRTRSR